MRPSLSLIAYSLGNLWRRLALPARIGNWSLTSLSTAAGEDRRSFDKACPPLLAVFSQSHLTRRPFTGMQRKIAALSLPAAQRIVGLRTKWLPGGSEVWTRV
jgi:hypothetical protein